MAQIEAELRSREARGEPVKREVSAVLRNVLCGYEKICKESPSQTHAQSIVAKMKICMMGLLPIQQSSKAQLLKWIADSQKTKNLKPRSKKK